jgi:hypothetical protein
VQPNTLLPITVVSTNAVEQTFTVSNIGTGTLTYTIADDAAWLSVSPDAGSSDGLADTITVTYNTAGLPVDAYTATITVTSPEATNSPQAVAVTLTVRPKPGDYDGDGDVDQSDFSIFQACFTGPGVAQGNPPSSAFRRLVGPSQACHEKGKIGLVDVAVAIQVRGLAAHRIADSVAG